MAPITKRSIFLSFCTAFAVYSVYVWTAGTVSELSLPPSRQAMAGQSLYQEKNCIACHQLYGLGGHLGPDLTNVTSAPGKGADYARAFIENGTVKMPDFGLDEAQVHALVQFLEFVNSAGTYRPRQSEINWYGTVAYDAGQNAR